MSGETFTDITVQGTANHNALLVTGTTTLTDLYITGAISYAIPPISTTHNILTVLTTNANAQSLVSNTPTTLLWSTVPAVPTYPPENVLGIPNLTYNPSTGHFSNTGTMNMILMLQATVVFDAPGGGSSGFRTISFAQTSAAIVGGKDAAGIIDGCIAGDIKALYIAGENPVVSYPDRKKIEKALEKVDFLVVQDLFLTEKLIQRSRSHLYSERLVFVFRLSLIVFYE